MGGQRRLHRLLRDRFNLGHASLHRRLHFLKRAHFDLPDALARDAELFRQLLQRHWIFGETTRLEDAALALIEHAEGLLQGA